MKSMQLITQQRADFSLRILNSAKELPAGEQKQIRTVANSIPAQIQRTGLGQTLAFALSKKDKTDGKGWDFFHQILQKWICEERKLYQSRDLMSSLTQGDMQQYQQAQAEALALLIWTRKFARAMLDNGK
ncbi:type III-B CRISPR module-associated protein Cmr5 [uncultured Shewanella sp.]|uniref:type III-B CRISPR module-associated protein Cmr5 n=1 Tax=uncultured Shewanella sp. TaxID=173975 RepID=UPI002624D817|nr:type III-B CRISPR module-associated protein Cmr5 [uncultured Shewanella sp.]